ncbi:hypothetical protein BH11CYA1_BH11CYA1_39260 [soil metagenome]
MSNLPNHELPSPLIIVIESKRAVSNSLISNRAVSASVKIARWLTLTLGAAALLSCSLMFGIASAPASANSTKADPVKTIRVGAVERSEEAKVPGWITDQYGNLIKHSRFSITAKGFRSDCIEAGYSLVAEAPKWNFFIFNDNSKTYFPFSTAPGKVTAAGSTSLLRATVMRNTAESIWTRGYQSKSLGHPVTVWKTLPKYKNATDYHVSELWVANDIAISPAAGRFGYCVNGYPKELLNMPFHLFILSPSGGKEVVMQTKSIKQAQLSPAIFKVPKGYKLAKSEMEVVMNTEDLTNIMDGLGSGK